MKRELADRESRSLRAATRALSRCANERFQARVQQLATGVWQIHKAKWLHPALGRPHGEQHLSFAVNGFITQMKDQLYYQLLIQRLFQMNDSAADRQLMEGTAQRTLVGQA